MEGSDTDHKTLQSPEQKEETREGATPFQNLTLGLITLSLDIWFLFLWGKKRKKKFYLKDTRSVATGHGSYNKWVTNFKQDQ